MSEYKSAVTALKKLATKFFKNRATYVNHIEGICTNLTNVSSEYEEQGYGKLSQSTNSLKNKLKRFSDKIESGKVSDPQEIKEQAQEYLDKLIELNPDSAPEHKHEKANIGNLTKEFEAFAKSKKKIEIDKDKKYVLEGAPLMMLFSGKLKPTQAKILKSLNAQFYEGTNVVVLPSMPILVVNKELCEGTVRAQIKGILRSWKRTNLAVFYDQAVEKNNFVAVMVLEPRIAELLSVILLDYCAKAELWIK